VLAAQMAVNASIEISSSAFRTELVREATALQTPPDRSPIAD
jgi:hypothetical protein